jgi:hypothetical protein
MHNPDIVASRGFQKNKTALFNGFEASFFIERTKEGIVLEIDTNNEFGETSQRIPLTKNALKELSIMFKEACKEKFFCEMNGLDK